MIPVVIAALFLLPPVGFAIVTLVVCMLAAWEWGQLSGFTDWFAASMVGGVMRVIVGADALSVAGISPNIHQPLVEISLWASLGWWIVALLLVLFYPVPSNWRNSKTLRLIFGVLTIVPFFWGMLALRAWHYDENHYSGAIWLLMS
ncbi:phosphatidate cytidylyltransferase [Escherichia coli]